MTTFLEECGIASLGWAVLPHPPYNLGLTLSVSHLFGLRKDGLCGQQFPNNDTIIAAVEQRITSPGADFNKCGMKSLVHCWQKCIANGGDYVEK